MKNLVVSMVLAVLLVGHFAATHTFADEIVMTKNGKKVLLKSNKTWEYVNGSQTAQGVNQAKLVQEWKIVGESGVVKFVYVSPDGLRDKDFIAQILHAITNKHGRERPIQVMMFDNQKFTPQGFPMTDAQMLHQKVQYNRNPNTGFEEFVWIKVVNSKTSPPELKHIKANIRPGYAE